MTFTSASWDKRFGQVFGSCPPDENAISIGNRRWSERVTEVCEGMNDLAAAFFEMPRERLCARRGSPGAARARQVAMYVAHVALRLSMKDVGRGFGRDRTTVLHACRVVEDLRDEPDFDLMVQTLERLARTIFAVRLGGCRG